MTTVTVTSISDGSNRLTR